MSLDVFVVVVLSDEINVYRKVRYIYIYVDVSNEVVINIDFCV